MKQSNHPLPCTASQDRALVFSANPLIRRDLQQTLRNARWQVEECQTVSEFLRLSDERAWSFVIVSESQGSVAAQEVLERLTPEIKAQRTHVVVLSESASYQEAMLRIHQGAAKYLRWPVLSGKVVEIAEAARRQSRGAIELPAEQTSTHRDRQSGRALIGGCSSRMLELSEQIVRVAQIQHMSIFISGETGTGKEVIARQLHQWSKRPGKFCAINCAAMNESLLESELFGHVKGAFTGANALKIGLWEEAQNGTLFLDEITEASPAMQSKLLRVMQEGVMRRVGSNQEIKVTARVIAASNRDLSKAIQEGVFREDLLYRFGEVLHLPPLRERVEDIPQLVAHFCEREGRGTRFMPEAMAMLCHYPWPGNVRQLENVITKLCSLCGPLIYPQDVARHVKLSHEPSREVTDLFLLGIMNTCNPSQWPSLQEFKERLVVHVYQYVGKEYQTAKILGLDYRTVITILKKAGIRPVSNVQ